MSHEQPPLPERQPDDNDPEVDLTSAALERDEEIEADEAIAQELIANLAELSHKPVGSTQPDQLQELETISGDMDRIAYAHQIFNGDSVGVIPESKVQALDGVFTKLGQIRNNKVLARLSATLFAFVAIAGAESGGVRLLNAAQEKTQQRIAKALDNGQLKINTGIDLLHSEQREIAAWLDRHPAATLQIENVSFEDDPEAFSAEARVEIKVTENGQTSSYEGIGSEEPSNLDAWLTRETAPGAKWTPFAERMAQVQERGSALREALENANNQVTERQ